MSGGGAHSHATLQRKPAKTDNNTNAGRPSDLVISMRQETWLFVRGEESVWLQTVSGCGLVMRGPSVHRTVKEFGSEEQRTTFIAQAEERLLASGWSVHRLGEGADRRHMVTVDLRRRDRRAG